MSDLPETGMLHTCPGPLDAYVRKVRTASVVVRLKLERGRHGFGSHGVMRLLQGE